MNWIKNNWLLIVVSVFTLFGILALFVFLMPEQLSLLNKVFTGSGVTIATIGLAVSTSWLVYVTFLSVMESKRIRSQYIEQDIRDRKERYFNEIVDWLTGMEERLSSSQKEMSTFKGIIEEVTLRDKIGFSQESWRVLDEKLKTPDEVQVLTTEISRGEYIQKLASTLDNKLAGTIMVVFKQLENMRNVILDWFEDKASETVAVEIDKSKLDELILDETKLLDNIGLSKLDIKIVKQGRIHRAIRKAISSAIDRATICKESLVEVIQD